MACARIRATRTCCDVWCPLRSRAEVGPPTVFRSSCIPSDSCSRRAASRKSVRRPVTRILWRRHDRRANHKAGRGQRPPCDLAHLGDAIKDTKFHQFPVNARSAPTRIGETHSSDEIPDFIGYRRAASALATLPGPVEPKAFPMPANDGPGLAIINADRHSAHRRDSQTQKARSAELRRSL
jgi:hypothetical protein